MLRKAVRFGLVGLCATLVHLIVASTLAVCSVPVTVANRIAFCCALCVGFAGHYSFTFADHSVSPRRAFTRYFIVAISGYLVNEIILAVLLSAELIPSVVALAMAITAAAAFSFFVSQKWAFRTGSN